LAELEREQLRESAARRDTDDVRGLDPVAVEHPAGVGDEIGARVRGAARLVARRSTGVAVVVTDHEPATVGEHPTEPFVPPKHRSADTHDEENRRVGRLAERLRAELDPAHVDY